VKNPKEAKNLPRGRKIYRGEDRRDRFRLAWILEEGIGVNSGVLTAKATATSALYAADGPWRALHRRY